MGWLVGTGGTNIHKVWISKSNSVITSRDIRKDEKVIYVPRLSDSSPKWEQGTSTTLNNVDLNESDNEIISDASDTAEFVEEPAESQDQSTTLPNS